jgi:Hg(II)-responsive transcriptional regulator
MVYDVIISWEKECACTVKELQMIPKLTIGKLSKQANVSIDSIRFYERSGLLAAPTRTASNYRQYPVDAVKRLRFIKRAQNLGFTLAEISDLMELSQQQSASKADVKKRTAEKILDIQSRIQDLNRMLKSLKTLNDHCDGHGPIMECPILNALTGDEEINRTD